MLKKKRRGDKIFMRTLTQLFKTDKSANLTVHYRVKVSEKNTWCDLCASGYWYGYKHL